MVEGSETAERPVDSSTIGDSLSQVLSSSRFRGSLQLQTLLKYIVEGSLSGHDDALKERIIGMDVFGRKSDYDTSDDPIVRSRVGQLRKRLAQYYESEEGKDASVQIVIPNGSYRPLFIYRPEANHGPSLHKYTEESAAPQTLSPGVVTPSAAEAAALHLQPAPRKSRRMWIAASIVVLLGLATVIAVKLRKSELELLWGPIVASKKTVILYTGTMSVYLPASNGNPSHSSGSDDLPVVDPPQPAVQDQGPVPNNLVRYPDGLAAPGDISADLKVGALMNAFGRTLSLRNGGNLPFLDLKSSPTVLVGAYDNYWTMHLSHNLPFFLDRAARIRERGGAHRVWSSASRADSTITDDYALVFRLVDSGGGSPVLAIGGLTTCGTQAAAEFVTDAAQVRKLAGLSREALAKKNLEFVLHASLVNCTPTSVDVVAQQSW